MPRKMGRNNPDAFRAADIPERDAGERDIPGTEATVRGPMLSGPVYIMKALEHVLADPDHPAELDSRLRTHRPVPGGPVQLRWTLASLREMATPDILGALAAMGVDQDEARFMDLAASWTSSILLSERHMAPKKRIPEPFDDDFPWLAATELWRRLLPERPCVEMVEEEIEDGYLDSEHGDPEEALDHWERAWQLLGKAVPASIDALALAEPALTEKSSGALEDWCDDYMDELEEESGYGIDGVRRRLAFCTGFLERFPGTEPKRLFRMRLAVALSYGMAGDDRNMDTAFEALARDHPDDLEVYLGWGDALWWCRIGGGTAGDRDRAEGLYKRALENPGDCRGDIEERLEYMRQEREDAG